MEALNEISMLVKEYISPETLWLVPCLYALGINIDPHNPLCCGDFSICLN